MEFAAAGVIFLSIVNLRGVKESVLLWMPVFFLFVASFTFTIIYGIVTHIGAFPAIAPWRRGGRQFHNFEPRRVGIAHGDFARYSSGAGTFTGIEAVSNSMASLREPRVQTGKRTMVYMGTSLSFVAAGCC